MIKANQRILNFISFFLDACIILTSYLVASWLWLDVARQDVYNFASLRVQEQGYFWAPVIYTLLMLLILALFGAYNTLRIHRTKKELSSIIAASFVGMLIIAAALYVVRLGAFSRGVLLVFTFINCILLCAKRLLTRTILRSLRIMGYNQKHVAVIGTGQTARQYIEDIRHHNHLGYMVDACFGQQSDALPVKQLGGFLDLEAFLSATDVDEVIIAIEAKETSWIPSSIALCEKYGVKVGIVPFYNEIIPAHPTIDIIGQTKIINLRSNPLDNLGYAALKRFLDIILSILLMVILSPFLVIIGIGTKLSSPGPILYKQDRLGKNKRLFTMYKFRSMRVNADDATAWTTSDDPRRTRFGIFMRKFSIDELPQLLNVLKGDMSLIGPRPEIPFYVDKFKDEVPLYMVKHQVRPGMTGWAQVNGYRGDTSIVERIKHDIWYIENWSLGLDVKILLLTVVKGWMNSEQLARKA